MRTTGRPPSLSPVLLLVGLLGACADDGASTLPSDGLEERPGLLDRSQGNAGSGAPDHPQACPAIALAPDGKCVPHDPNAACPLPDPDCAPSPPPVACTKIWKPADGRCDLSDPCAKLQDEDCQSSTSPGDPGCGVVCPAIAYETNGKCEAPPECAHNDPEDCASDGGIACIAIRYADNGKCEAARGCEQNDPIDCAADDDVACIEIRYPDNGKCEAVRGCEYTDPRDCRPIACTLIYVPKDGVCPRNDPCDPDCR